MSGFWSRKGENLQKPFPECMGRMINIFDLSAGMAGTKLLTDKANRDGSPVRRNRPDVVKKTTDSARVELEDKPVVKEMRRSSSSKKSGGTTMKMLIAQEMSKETESKRKPPGVVAKLMGLDALPAQQPTQTAKSSRECHSHSTLGGALWRSRSQQSEESYLCSPSAFESHSIRHEKDYKDVYEVWQQPSKSSQISDQELQSARFYENMNENRMALVRQNFMEAKRLATDEKLLQSKEFQDALEVLSSNKDLFLKFLEEPNSLFSKHLHELQSIPPLPQTKRITVLKPSKAAENKAEKHVKKHQHPAADNGGQVKVNHDLNSSFTSLGSENISQPTRIVVLKPSPGKTHEVKARITSPSSSPKLEQQRGLYGGLETEEAIESGEVSKEITQQMRESLNSNRRDDSLLSSVLSNGYVGDESSFNRSEIGYVEEESGSFSESEAVTPTSRHSWDYMNRVGSPYSLSSFSRASYSPESSVIREAKKRLSERLALVVSNGASQDQKHVWRSSSTLGEMLAISDVKKEEGSDRKFTTSSSRSFGGEEDLKSASACLTVGRTKDECLGGSLGNLSRSKSVPVSSSTYDNIGSNVEAPGLNIMKSSAPAEAPKSKSRKPFFKGKVSSLFFLMNKKPGKDKSVSSPMESSDDKLKPRNMDSVGERNDKACFSHDSPTEGFLVNRREEPCTTSSPPTSFTEASKHWAFTAKAALTLEKPGTSERSSENQGEPSPVSVLEAPFEDDANSSMLQASQRAGTGHLQALSRSAPIESLARSLSWDDTKPVALSRSLLKRSAFSHEADEEKERSGLIQNLLSSTGFDNENANVVLLRWHSLDSPLDPRLLDKFLDHREEGGNSRERRSNQRLLFDCVNAALLQIGRSAMFDMYPQAGGCRGAWKDVVSRAVLGEEVRRLIHNWFSSKEKLVSSETENNNLAVNRVVRKEILGNEWSELMWLELDNFSKEIVGGVLENLIGEALSDLIDGVM